MNKIKLVFCGKFLLLTLVFILGFALVSAGDFDIYNKSYTSQSYFFVDGTNGLVGIGTTTPSAKLDVEVSSGGAATIGSYLNTATGDYAIAMGFGTNASRPYSIAMGYNTTASENYSTAMGGLTIASGYFSTAMGIETIAQGHFSTAMGSVTNASGQASTAMGRGTIASGAYSTAMGYYTIANYASTAMGEMTTASGDTSTAMGFDTTALGETSTAMGLSTTASGVVSTAMGEMTTASGDTSTAMGRSTTASGAYSTAMGDATTALGETSTAMGTEINVSGDYSFGISLNDPASDYLVTDNNVMAIMGGNVGIGTTSPTQRLEVNGSINISGIGFALFFPDGTNMTTAASGSGIPANTISAFYQETCPTGWIIADGTSGTPDLRGIFIRGAGTSGVINYANGTDMSAIYGEYLDDSMQGHEHTFSGNALGTHEHSDTLAFSGNALGTHEHTDSFAFSGNAMSNHGHSDSFATGTESQTHTHDSMWYYPAVDRYAGSSIGRAYPGSGYRNTGANQQSHTHPVTGSVTSASAGTPAGSITGSVTSASAGTPAGSITGSVTSASAGTPAGTISSPSIDSDGTPRTGAETAPASFALIYCMKTIEDSATSNTIWGESGDNVFVQNIIKNVGIGTNSPTQKLEVNGSINISGTGSALFFPDGTNMITAATGSGSGDSLWTNSSGNATYTAGSVGIGTTSPDAKLEVKENIADVGFRMSNIHQTTGDKNSIRFGFKDSANNEYVGAAIQATAESIIDGSEDTKLDFFASESGTNSIKLTIKPNGNVGIGTASPSVKLDVAGGVHIGVYNQSHFLSISPFDENNISYISARQNRLSDQGTTKLAFQVYNNSQANIAMIIDNLGNVGIGTSSPSAKLEIDNGGIRALASTGTEVTPVGGIGLELHYNSDSAQGRVFAYDRDSSLYKNLHLGITNQLFLKSDGNVGIGTSSPSSKLQINTYGAIDESTGWMNIGSNSYFNGSWNRINTSRGGANLHINAPEDSLGEEFRFMIMNETGATNTIARIGSNQTFFNGGNVGIGTTSPSAKLDVEVSSGGAATIGSSENTATGDYAVAMGYNTNASGDISTAMGFQTTASESHSTAMGYSTTALGWASTAMGFQTTASGFYSTAMGEGTIASGNYAVAMGRNTNASDQGSTAMGEGTIASGGSSTAMGYFTTALGGYSTAMGGFTTASGSISTAMGEDTIASGWASTAMGREIEAGGDYSFAIALNDQNRANCNLDNKMCIMGGEVLIGKLTDSGAYPLQVSGEICETTAGTSACSSDARLKENILPLNNGLDLIMNLKPKTFNFIGSSRNVAGFIAQDINITNPDWIIKHDSDEYITFDDKGYLQTGIVKAIQELKVENDLLKEDLCSLGIKRWC
jgi:hypothetical protein